MERSSAGSCAGVVACPKSFQAIAVLGEDKGSGRCWRSIRDEASRVPDRGICRYLKWGAGLRTGSRRADRVARLVYRVIPLQNPVMTDDRRWGDVRHASEQTIVGK